jgi:hypothetical protein
LVESEPNKFLVDRGSNSIAERSRNLARTGTTVATLPNKRGCLVQAMRAIAVEIINQHLIRQLSNH